ncbi:hypothetical protein G6F32_015095 [Rhizopus arrhizus]|nr:hypothetical protein G6F32_015095 [Rhizopus arrhizus]
MVGRRRQAAAAVAEPRAHHPRRLQDRRAEEPRRPVRLRGQDHGAASVRRRGARQRHQEPAAGSATARDRDPPAGRRGDVRRRHADRPPHALHRRRTGAREDLPPGG